MTNVTMLDLQKQADIRNPETLLERALPLMMSAVPAITRAEVFRLTRGGMVIWHGENSTYEDGAFVPLQADALHQRAINQQSPMVSDDQLTIIIPFINQGDAFAVLVLSSDTPIDLETVVPYSDDLAVLLYAKLVERILKQQISLTGQLSIAQSLAEIASMIAKTILQSGQFIGMQRLLFDDDGNVTGGEIVATANRQQGYPHNISVDVDLPVIQNLDHLLRTEGEILVTDVAQDDRFTDDGKEWLYQQNVKSLFILPLWIHNQLSAFLSIVDTHAVLAPSVLEKEMYQNMVHQAAIAIEKQQLLEQSQRTAQQSIEQVDVLRQINTLIAQAKDSQGDRSLLQRTAEILKDVTAVDHVGIVMREGNQAYVVSEAPSLGLIGQRIEADENSFYALLEDSKKTIIVTKVATDATVPDHTRQTLMDNDVKSIVVVPMFDENDVLIGTVGLDYFTEQAEIDAHTIEVAQTVVAQIALSLQRTRLLAESQQKAQQLERLTEFGQSLRAYLTRREILQTTLAYCPDVMNADYTSVLLYDRAMNGIRNTATHFNGDDTINLEARIIKEDDNSIALQAWTSLELVQIDDLHSDWAWQHPLHRDLQAILAIPLTLAGVTLGVLEVGSVNPHQFNQTDVTTLRQISNQLAIALSNAEAYSQSQRLARNKTQANEIIAQLQQQLEVSDILQVTARELGKALGAKRARIRLGTNPTQTGGND